MTCYWPSNAHIFLTYEGKGADPLIDMEIYAFTKSSDTTDELDQTQQDHGINLIITLAWYSLEEGCFTFH